VQKAIVGNIFSLGICGLVVVALSNYFGRLPVIFLFQSLALATCAWAAAATSLKSFIAARILNGLVASAAQGGALMWIKDLFFFHEHPRKINYVEFPIILSPYLGPLITAFIEYKVSWRWGFWVCTILWGIGWLLIAGLLDEPYYDRTIPEEQQAPRQSRWLRLIGVEQLRAARSERRPLSVMLQPIMVITNLPVLLIVIYYLLNFAWVISVNTTISIWLVNFYAFNTKNLGETCMIFFFPAQHCPSPKDSLLTRSQGFFYFFGITGVTLGWLIGHWMHDAFGTFYAQRHGGRILPEARLTISYPATLIMVVSLIIIGLGVQRHWHYMILAVFAAAQCCGIMICTTAVNAYLLDCYPGQSGEVSAWVSIGRIWGGFMATYIQLPWVQEIGAAKVLGIQAAITFAASFVIIFLQVYGRRIRQWQEAKELVKE
jgi:MFS family permease